MARLKAASVEELTERVQKLENKFNIAATLAVFLGISVAGLGGWVQSEKKEVSSLNDQIKQMAPIVATAQADIKKTSQEQLQLIQSRAEPIVRDIAQRDFAHSSAQTEQKIKMLEEDTFFLMFAEIVYPPTRTGRYHDMIDNRKNLFFTRYNRPKEEIQGELAKQGFPAN
jgi:hypothetical protein